MRIPPPPPPPPPPTSRLKRECKSHNFLSEIAARIARSPIIPLHARKSYIPRGPSSLVQLKSKSRRDLVKTSLLSATCDSTVDEHQEAAPATFSQPTKRLEQNRGNETPRKSNVIDASPTSRRKSSKASEASPRAPARKTLKTPDESPITDGKSSSSSRSKKKSKSSPGDCATPEVINNRKKVYFSSSEKKTRSKKYPARNTSTDDINWLKADPIDVSNSDWAMLDVEYLVNASISNPKKSAGSVDDTSSDEDSWCKLSLSMGLGDSLHKKTTPLPATKKKNRVKKIRGQ